MLELALVIVGAYLIGSVSFAVLVSKAFGLPDPHDYGSGNPGATNVLRTGNKAAALLTLFGDGAKGFVAVFAVEHLAAAYALPRGTVAAASLAVFVGHVYPVFHRFSGGKGVATAAGIVFAWHWPLGLALSVIWLVMAVGFKISSLAALTTAVLLPLGALYFFGVGSIFGSALLICALIFWRHRSNIRQLATGSERKIGG